MATATSKPASAGTRQKMKGSTVRISRLRTGVSWYCTRKRLCPGPWPPGKPSNSLKDKYKRRMAERLAFPSRLNFAEVFGKGLGTTLAIDTGKRRRRLGGQPAAAEDLILVIDAHPGSARNLGANGHQIVIANRL